ncbi:MAG: hypothetical protein PHS46_07985 [Candidatus Omnitrophica bacterium]|nr:hypothetical protein [Candidatus Omnitrophota bacterium]
MTKHEACVIKDNWREEGNKPIKPRVKREVYCCTCGVIWEEEIGANEFGCWVCGGYRKAIMTKDDAEAIRGHYDANRTPVACRTMEEVEKIISPLLSLRGDIGAEGTKRARLYVRGVLRRYLIACKGLEEHQVKALIEAGPIWQLINDGYVNWWRLKVGAVQDSIYADVTPEAYLPIDILWRIEEYEEAFAKERSLREASRNSINEDYERAMLVRLLKKYGLPEEEKTQ